MTMTSPKGMQLAKEVGVAPETLNQWADEFQIPLPERYQRNALRVLKMVKELKDKNCGFNTIQRHIQLDYPELKSPAEDMLAGFTALAEEKEDLSTHFSKMRTELLELGELAEKYAQANYNIGQMTMQLRQLEEENHRLRSQLKLLPSAEAWETMKEQELSYENMLSTLQQRVRSLEDQLQQADRPRSLPELPVAPHKAQLKLPFTD